MILSISKSYFDIGWPKHPIAYCAIIPLLMEAAGRPATGQLRCISTLCDDAGAFYHQQLVTIPPLIGGYPWILKKKPDETRSRN